MERVFAGRNEWTGVAASAFGADRRLAGVERLRGGSKKGVYRLAFDDGTSVIGYIWSAEENYWPGAGGPDHGPFGDASGAGLFEAAHAELAGLGVRVPRVYLIDRSRAAFAGDVALVEDVRGGTLESWLDSGRAGGEKVLARLAGALELMRARGDRRIGKLGLLGTDRSGAAGAGRAAATEQRTCEQIVLDRAMDHLARAAARVERVAAARARLAEITGDLFAAVRPRTDHRLIHGELGPDHVLIDGDGQPVLIDIEGLMFFDVEWEHVFLELRFGRHYPVLRPGGLDERRLAFYRLAMHLSLIAGPLRLLDGDFPDREPMREIVDYNVGRALAFVR
jgi:Phosphotransferase enzyme family